MIQILVQWTPQKSFVRFANRFCVKINNWAILLSQLQSQHTIIICYPLRWFPNWCQTPPFRKHGIKRLATTDTIAPSIHPSAPNYSPMAPCRKCRLKLELKKAQDILGARKTREKEKLLNYRLDCFSNAYHVWIPLATKINCLQFEEIFRGAYLSSSMLFWGELLLNILQDLVRGK